MYHVGFERVHVVHAWETFEVVIRGTHGCSVLDREGGDMCI